MKQEIQNKARVKKKDTSKRTVKQNNITTIHKLVSNPIFEICFIEALIPFEHIGLKWIMSQRFCDWSESKHKHAFDELRHGNILLQYVQNIRLNLNSSDLYSTIHLSSACQKNTTLYLKKLFHEVLTKVYKVTTAKDKYHYSYCLLSLLIEKRLMNIYPHMTKLPTPKALQKIMATMVEDEFGHLNSVSPDAQLLKNKGLDLNQLINFEENLIQKWYHNIEQILLGRILQ